MSLLKDTEIVAALTSNPPLAQDVKTELLKTTLSPVKGASLDLTVGKIFVPRTEPDMPGSIADPLTELALLQGHTAVIETLEHLNVPSDMAAIAFPPSSVSMAGLLTTNPGHVDPGYRGPLHLTVINMGRLPFSLKRGDRIIRLLSFSLSADAQAPAPKKPQITQALLERLSQDFIDVDERAAKAAEKEVTKANLVKDVRSAKLTLYATIAGGLFALAVAVIGLYNSSNNRDIELRKEIADVRNQMAKFEAKISAHESLANLSERIAKLEAGLGTRGAQGIPPSPPSRSPNAR